jgi:hypothetical protein
MDRSRKQALDLVFGIARDRQFLPTRAWITSASPTIGTELDSEALALADSAAHSIGLIALVTSSILLLRATRIRG